MRNFATKRPQLLDANGHPIISIRLQLATELMKTMLATYPYQVADDMKGIALRCINMADTLIEAEAES